MAISSHSQPLLPEPTTKFDRACDWLAKQYAKADAARQRQLQENDLWTRTNEFLSRPSAAVGFIVGICATSGPHMAQATVGLLAAGGAGSGSLLAERFLQRSYKCKDATLRRSVDNLGEGKRWQSMGLLTQAGLHDMGNSIGKMICIVCGIAGSLQIASTTVNDRPARPPLQLETKRPVIVYNSQP